MTTIETYTDEDEMRAENKKQRKQIQNLQRGLKQAVDLANSRPFTPAQCHPHRPVAAVGLCRPCYYVERGQEAQWSKSPSPALRAMTGRRYKQMLTEQGGVCKTCLEPPTKRRLTVDVDYKVQKIRGLLCARCRFSLLVIKPSVLRRVADYIEGRQSKAQTPVAVKRTPVET